PAHHSEHDQTSGQHEKSTGFGHSRQLAADFAAGKWDVMNVRICVTVLRPATNCAAVIVPGERSVFKLNVWVNVPLVAPKGPPCAAKNGSTTGSFTPTGPQQ